MIKKNKAELLVVSQGTMRKLRLSSELGLSFPEVRVFQNYPVRFRIH
jgi:hypothetical protein